MANSYCILHLDLRVASQSDSGCSYFTFTYDLPFGKNATIHDVIREADTQHAILDAAIPINCFIDKVDYTFEFNREDKS